jgi:tetratricopeptide (TPR) repeat protein
MKKSSLLTLLFVLSMTPVFAQQPGFAMPDSTVLKTLFFAGLRDKLNENYPKAAESFAKILAMDPNHAAANYEMAVINFRQNNLLDAEISIKKATAADGGNLWYWRLLSELYKRKGDMDALVKVFDQMIRIAPEDDSFYFDRCNAWLLAGKIEEALKGYDELEKKFGSSEALTKARQRAAGGRDAARTPDRKGAKAVEEPVGDDQALLNEGQRLYGQGNLTAALERFQLVLKHTDQIYAAWERTMSTQLSLELYQDAIKTGDEALSLYPSQSALYLYMAVAQMNAGRLDEALASIKTAMQLNEGDMVLLECYGDVLFLKGDAAGALAQWKKSRAGGNGSDKLKKKIDEKKYIK